MIRCLSDLKPTLSTTQGLLLLLLATATLGSGGMQSPALAADAAAGKALALQWCSSCHLVADDQPTAASTSLPTFYDISKDPEWTEATLATFLADPHPKMPNMNLGNTEIANLAKYINSLSSN